MYVVLAESKSDFNCLKTLIRLLAKNNAIPVKGKGFGSCGEMVKEGAALCRLHKAQGYRKFIICHDKDKATRQEQYNKVASKIIKPAKIENDSICIVIPTEELEAWILADIKAVSNVISSWKPTEKFDYPETVSNPKEKLEKLSENPKQKPLYNHAVYNEKVMQHLDLNIVKKKCPSFRELADFIEQNQANYPQS
jgi:hypothetical protein